MRVRRVERELLDSLPPEDSEARRSRRDLRLINAIMGNTRWLVRRAREVPAGLRWLELGAGDGMLARRLARIVGEGGGTYSAIDLAPRPEGLPNLVEWRRGDLLEAGALDGADVIVANLILHHFEDATLRKIGGGLARCSHFLACEPARHPFHLASLKLLHPCLGRVTQHDAAVSIRAGFLGDELMQSLGLDGRVWHHRSNHTLLGGYRVLARRIQQAGGAS
jgi:SAM-dependent methyltransferase